MDSSFNMFNSFVSSRFLFFAILTLTCLKNKIKNKWYYF